MRVEDSRARLARYRDGMKALKDDVTYTRQCEAHLGQVLLGAAHDQGPAIPPPQYQPGPEDFARVADDFTALPRVLQRAT